VFIVLNISMMNTPILREQAELGYSMAEGEIFWRWERHIPKNICNAVIKEAEKIGTSAGVIGGGVVDPKIRDNTVAFLPPAHWFEGTMINMGMYANDYARWQFDIVHTQPIQIAKYTSAEFYTWHEDGPVTTNGLYQRKLTVVTLLSDPKDFEGGQLEIERYGTEESRKDPLNALFKNQGDVIVFPSTHKHRVTPVTQGTRYSAVDWLVGPKFK
jgi:PKHD-type hydroxylase